MKLLRDKNGKVLKEGDRVFKTCFYRGKKNGHVYKIVKWIDTRSLFGYNITNRTWYKVV